MNTLHRFMFRGILLMAFLSVLPFSGSAQAPQRVLYARAEIPTPVLNTADFRSVFGGKDGHTLNRDVSGLVRAVEFIALPGTVFKIEESYRIYDALIYRVRTSEYPRQPSGLYIDSRFVSVSQDPLESRVERLPPKKQIIERMLSNQGARYVWGGNVAQGVPELLQFYPPSSGITAETQDMWSLKGLDCSGLLYEAANGATPRNTSDLINYGKPVAIAGLTAKKIAAKLLPLDLITWKGHVIIVLDQTHTIESCMGCSKNGGVTVRNLLAVLKEVMQTRKPANRYPQNPAAGEKPFVIRRWI